MDGSSDRDSSARPSSRVDDTDGTLHSTTESSPEPAGPGRSTAGAGQESPLYTIGVAAGLGLAGVVGLVIVTLVVGRVLLTAGFGLGEVLLVSVTLGQPLGFVGVGTVYLRRRGLEWREIRTYLGVRPPSLREVGIVVGGYIVLIGLLLAVVAIVLSFLPQPAENQGAVQLASNPELIPLGIAMMFLVVGPCEEFLFRGVVQNRIRERLPAAPTIAIAAVLFAVVHVISAAGSPAAVAVLVGVLLVPGVVLGAVYEYTGNLVVPWLLHSIHNSVLLAALLLVDGSGGAATLLSTVGLA